MKTQKPLTCPGCHKHCKEGAPRCKYGCRYFAKLSQPHPAACPKKDCKHKTRWESLVEPDGLAWQLFSTSRSFKKALKNGRVTEAELFSPLTDDERSILSQLLNRLASAAE